jgi:hypothetical protein
MTELPYVQVIFNTQAWVEIKKISSLVHLALGDIRRKKKKNNSSPCCKGANGN